MKKEKNDQLTTQLQLQPVATNQTGGIEGSLAQSLEGIEVPAVNLSTTNAQTISDDSTQLTDGLAARMQMELLENCRHRILEEGGFTESEVLLLDELLPLPLKTTFDEFIAHQDCQIHISQCNQQDDVRLSFYISNTEERNIMKQKLVACKDNTDLVDRLLKMWYQEDASIGRMISKGDFIEAIIPFLGYTKFVNTETIQHSINRMKKRVDKNRKG